MTDPLDRLQALLDQQHETYAKVISAVRAQERILAVAPILVALGDVLRGVIELEPELAPEVAIAVEATETLAATFDRMQTFVATRLDVQIEAALAELGEADDRPDL